MSVLAEGSVDTSGELGEAVIFSRKGLELHNAFLQAFFCSVACFMHAHSSNAGGCDCGAGAERSVVDDIDVIIGAKNIGDVEELVGAEVGK
ncbi:hypothetical protein CFELI_00035 [Corynebacterium felinum]|nr:hypothetical protein CFELI_00035 [Corynebacterium felinum]